MKTGTATVTLIFEKLETHTCVKSSIKVENMKLYEVIGLLEMFKFDLIKESKKRGDSEASMTLDKG